VFLAGYFSSTFPFLYHEAEARGINFINTVASAGGRTTENTFSRFNGFCARLTKVK
jgi:hypothetical protein